MLECIGLHDYTHLLHAVMHYEISASLYHITTMIQVNHKHLLLVKGFAG